MNLEQLFSLCNGIAFIGWIVLIIFPERKWAHYFLIGVIATSMSLLYSVIIFHSIALSDFENFNSLEGVMQLFTNEQAVLAGWIHYLVFDLMVGMYIVNNGKKFQINRWFILPCLVFTFMLGPFGLLLYLIIRAIKTKQYFHHYA